MRKFTQFLSMMLMTLMLMPMTLMAEQSRVVLSFVDGEGSTVREATATLGEDFAEPRLVINPSEADVRVVYSSTNSTVASVDMMTGEVTLVAAGITYITATSGETEAYSSGSARYKLTVQEASTPPVVPTCPEAKYYYNGSELTTMTLQVGDVVSIPSLLGATGQVFSLSAKTVEGIRVAELTEDDMIHATGEGTAVFVGGINYRTGDTTLFCEYSFNIVVEAAATPTCPDAAFYYNGAMVTSITLTAGKSVSVPMLMTTTGGMISGRASIENTNIAMVGADNMIYALAEGTTRYKVIYTQSTGGGALNCEYDLGIVVEAAAPEKADPQLSFSATEVDVELGETFVAPTLINPNNIPLTPTNSKWYTQWDSQIAQVNEQTGAVTLLGGIGDETISFEFTGNDTYKNAIVSYTLHVTTMGLKVGGINVTNKNAGDILGDQGSITYDPINHILTMTNATISGTGMNLAPAIKRATAEELPASGILYTDKAPLTIVLNGGNGIAGVEAGIYTVSAPVVMMGGKDGGNIRISASTVGVKAQPFKIYKCTVSAYGGAAAIATTELGVATGGWLVAQGPSLAIQATSFVKAEDNNGEGIDILTAGVHFAQKPNPGFYTDDKNTKPATFVEIGKVAVVVPDDEVTEITFTETDPEGNESVIFSADANNTYNETTGQLEITTTLTDEQVANALETLIPGSSQWTELLPGSLVFDIPAGEGEIEVKCMTIPGYSLQVKMEGKAAVSITQTSLGWAKVVYNVTEPLHVVIYLHATANAAPARIASAMNDTDPTVGAYIEALKITPKNATTAIDVIEANKAENGKILMNGQLYIIRDGRVFNAVGAEVR